MKVFHDIPTPEERVDILREVAILKECRDRHVVNFLGACVVDEQVMLVMEYMEAGDLWHAIRNTKKYVEIISWYKRGRHIATQIARGLHYLHWHKIIHFDLKSPNVLLNDDCNAKLSDVGFAKLLSNSHVSNHAAGFTFAWAAPEVLLGKACTEKVDIYSYGVILWELVTGEQPRRGFLRHARVPEECPAEVDELIQCCLSEKPGDRPSCREIIEKLSQQS